MGEKLRTRYDGEKKIILNLSLTIMLAVFLWWAQGNSTATRYRCSI